VLVVGEQQQRLQPLWRRAHGEIHVAHQPFAIPHVVVGVLWLLQY
jgi:hypothetical protein